MALQIAIRSSSQRSSALARATGLTRTAVVEGAAEALLLDRCADQMRGMRHRINAILSQIDRIPHLPEPIDPLDWGESGLPRGSRWTARNRGDCAS
jgi:hypothetical protein